MMMIVRGIVMVVRIDTHKVDGAKSHATLGADRVCKAPDFAD